MFPPLPSKQSTLNRGLEVERFDASVSHHLKFPCSSIGYRAPGYEPGCCRFKSCQGYHFQYACVVALAPLLPCENPASSSGGCESRCLHSTVEAAGLESASCRFESGCGYFGESHFGELSGQACRARLLNVGSRKGWGASPQFSALWKVPLNGRQPVLNAMRSALS